MKKQFKHSIHDSDSDCGWTYTDSDEYIVVDAAIEHLLNCEKSTKNFEDKQILRLIVMAGICLVDTEDTGKSSIIR